MKQPDSSALLATPVAALLAAVLAGGAVLAAPTFAAADLIDQANECGSAGFTTIGMMQPAGQSFQPELELLVAVELRLIAMNSDNGTVTINVREDDFAGSIVGTATRNLSGVDDFAGAWYRFDFASPLQVVPDTTYLLEILGDNALGLGDADCGYTRGQAFEQDPFETVDFSFRTYGSCGDGDVDAGEECDDGVPAPGGCCTVNCQFVDAGDSCVTADTDLCTQETCDGAGSCESQVAPVAMCSGAENVSLGMTRSSRPGKDKIKFKWKNGVVTEDTVAALADDGTLALCVYVGDDALVAHSQLPGSAAWTVKGSGDSQKIRYKDNNGLIDGITSSSITQVTGLPESSVSFQAGGDNLTGFMMTGQLTGVVTAQVISSAGGCWGAEFGTDQIKKNDGEKFKAVVK